tara:strand:+ start:231 stop:494 length:264 start_codon:yes stop_codon:yes gene_type:complete
MSKMGQKFVEEQDLKSLQSMYNDRYNDSIYMSVDGKDIEWSIECALKAAGALDYEPMDAYFTRVKRYAKEILKTKKELADEVNGGIY